MGKTGKWIKSFWSGKKDPKISSGSSSNNGGVVAVVNQSAASSSDQHHNPRTTPVVVIPRPTTPKEKKRWSFRRSSATASATAAKDPSPAAEAAAVATTATPPPPEVEAEREKQELAGEGLLPIEAATDVAVVVAAAEAEAEAKAEAADVMISVIGSSSTTDGGGSSDMDEAAALKIQSVFRSYLARKALKALRGLVKLQALVRGHLVRKQATATLRCMQALVTAQARARAQRIRSGDEGKIANHRHSTHRRSSQERIKYPYQDMEENIKIVEMDHGEFNSNSRSRSSYSNTTQHEQFDDRMDNRIATYYSSQRAYTKQDYQHISPAPSAITDLSPRTCSGHFEDYSFATAQSSPRCYSAMSKPDDPSRTPFSFPRPEYAETMMSYDYPLYPNYMSNTKSSIAKARSQSAPKQRPPEFERQPSRGRRPSVEGRGIPKGARMQRSSSHVGSATTPNLQYPWSIKLDKSAISLRDSECGSTCSVLTNANYCRSVVSYDPRY